VEYVSVKLVFGFELATAKIEDLGQFGE